MIVTRNFTVTEVQGGISGVEIRMSETQALNLLGHYGYQVYDISHEDASSGGTHTVIRLSREDVVP